MVLFFLYLFIVELGKRYDFFVDNIKICYNELEKKYLLMECELKINF